jgi:hypothetical protein
MKNNFLLKSLSAFVIGGMLLSACSEDNTKQDAVTPPTPQPTAPQTPTEVPLARAIVPGITIQNLMHSDIDIPASPGFVFGGSADGMGFYKNGDNYVMLTNHEDNFSVSRVTFDANLKPIKGDYLLTSDEGRYRLCSATLATQAEHGYDAFLTCGESSASSQSHVVTNLNGPVRPQNTIKPALGYWNAENALPLPKTAYPGKTVVIIGDDDSGSSSHFGQVVVYISDAVGDFENGKIYVLTRDDGSRIETDLKKGVNVNVTFKEIVGAKTMDFNTFNAAVGALNPVGFGRVEDLDYRKDGVGREIYFQNTGFNSVASGYNQTKYGRVYKLVLPTDFTTTLKGSMQLILDGDAFQDVNNNGVIDPSERIEVTARERAAANGAATEKCFTNLDNICATQNYLYLQEDSNGYGNEQHDGYIYQYNLATGELKAIIELNHFRSGNAPEVKGSLSAGNFGSWEYGAMVDVSSIINQPDAFLVCLQPHGWRGGRYSGADGGSLRVIENQASQVILVKGIAR